MKHTCECVLFRDQEGLIVGDLESSGAEKKSAIVLNFSSGKCGGRLLPVSFW